MTKSVAPPASTGAAGPQFEAQVCAYYLLAMLRGAEPRGLPGTTFDRVELQRASEGHPLDDIIIHSHDEHGAPAVLEVQVKRAISFAPKDQAFKEIVGQIAAVMQEPKFWSGRHELAVATAQTTRVITGSYQEVLNWARKMGSAASFMARIARPRSANDDMRAFVATLRSHLQAANAAHDDETVWQVLRRLQIHIYDFTAVGSVSENHARDRAADALQPDAKAQAGALWSALIAYALDLATGGGDTTRRGLIDEFRGDFRLEGDRRYGTIRAAIAEASQQALDDISDTVQGIVLGRAARITSVRAAADAGRFVEIRGDAGVGKSGLLKHLAEEVARESRILVLAPVRVAKRGWSAMRAQFGFDGTVRELLSDLASDGGGWVFIDNLDFFTAEERLTVNDVVRAAADVPGVIVITTSRRRFGLDEPSWLPEDAIARLGRSDVVLVGELSEDEIAELREAEPRLHALLATDHPAREVTRNLFRLSRLVQAPEDKPEPRSEADMAELWWRTADGADDVTQRERARLLRGLAALSLKGDQIFDVAAYPPAAIDALIETESLLDLGDDRVAFRHDVLREWAIANLLVNPESLDELPIEQTASPALARGLELAARLALEKARDPDHWRVILEAVSGAEAHPSWRRAVLLAIAHSEIAGEVVPLMAETLLVNDAALLRELIPVMMSVDVLPMRDMYVAAGVDASAIPDTLSIPSSPGWIFLVQWLLQLGNDVPAAAMPEVVDLFVGWCSIGLFVPEPLTLAVLARFEIWLVEIEKSNDAESWRENRTVFGGVLARKDLTRIEEDLRTYFSLLANRVPELAKEYLRSVQTLRRKEDVYAKLLEFSGTLAQAAPEGLAAITLDALVRPEQDASERSDRWFDDAFTHTDHEFLPASPAQGPFFDLLTHAPTVGLQLIRNLIDKAIEFHARGEAAEDHNPIVIEHPDGARRFPWLITYGWSRTSHYYSITSALMALEAWAHVRIEKGDAIDAVIADIIGSPDAPAAYVLVVVDILLSHWPASRAAAVPYVACPELLSIDLGRPMQEGVELPDIFGLNALQKEPSGPKLEALRRRVSRRVSLDHLLLRYATNEEWNDLREKATSLLTKAVDRLGPYQPGDDLSNPRLMAFHALNMLDPANYVEAELERGDGSKVPVRQFVPPEAEAKHFEPQQKEAIQRNSDFQSVTTVIAVIDHPERSSSATAETLADWAQKEKSRDPDDEDKTDVVDQAVVGAAMVAMRDGTPELRKRVAHWAEGVFARALAGEPDVGRRIRSGMLYNPVAMAFAGRVFALRDCTPTRDDFKRLLDMASADPAAAHGAGPAAGVLRALDVRLARAVLRVAFAACVRVWHAWNASDTAKAAADEALRVALNDTIDAELTWLCSGGDEPAWPTFPPEAVRSRSRRGIRIGAPREDKLAHKRDPRNVFVDHQAAALWLRTLWQPAEANRDWLRDLHSTYAAWTLSANGAGFAEEEETAERPSEWNSIFFAVMANCLPGWPQADVETTITPILALQDERFYGVSAEFLRSLDAVFFNNASIEPAVAVAVRAKFAERLERSYGWRRLRGTKSDGIELHLGPAVAVHFFSDHHFGQAPKCYLFEKAIDPSLVFVPVLQKLAVTAPSPFVAIIALNWLEVAPQLAQAPLLLALTAAALEVYPDDRSFWIDHGIGRRVSKWMDAVRVSHPEAFAPNADARPEIDRLLAKLVAVGVVEARRLEVVLDATGK
ncbi:NACHT domain-containing protein [Allomesorhizobium camelthorni]|uniref:ATP-binding protein n=1 Tax=Allomesorhizobium camelthorni TaxID=475069 RepID=A0A6G4WI73_9HYPH|nr:ATP-binding protein [Mesorhizobium camelthorni]NGO54299.1 ATP-binding protein [Mesorhizobium camelthorni]